MVSLTTSGRYRRRSSRETSRLALSKLSRLRTVRLLVTTSIVAVFYLLVAVLQGRGSPEYFFLLLPAIFLAATLFERGYGIYAACLSTLFLYASVVLGKGLLVPPRFVPALTIFLVMALGIAVLGERLKSAFERASAAERAKDLLLRELNHRTKNNLAIVISMLSVERLSNKSAEARAALEQAVHRVTAIARAHDCFLPREDVLTVQMRDYLANTCAHLEGAIRGIRSIAIKVHTDEFVVSARDAIAIGLIVNELVTNAIKHAFPNDRAGTIEVICKNSAPFELIVEDDGVGCSSPEENSGSRLTRLLARQLGAEIVWENTGHGCRARVAALR